MREQGFETTVVRNDALSVDEVHALSPSKIIISPGPCDPSQAGISVDLIRQFGEKTPILGVCLGHQAIVEAYGGKVVRALQPMHGKMSLISHDKSRIFENIPSPLKVGRYHSLIVEKASFPDTLKITAESETGEIMALAHRDHPVYGVQFHPESIMTEHGALLLQNFLNI